MLMGVVGLVYNLKLEEAHELLLRVRVRDEKEIKKLKKLILNMEMKLYS